jgi:hypothetical protein
LGRNGFIYIFNYGYFLNFRKYSTAVLLLGIIGGLHHFEILLVSCVSLLIYQFLRLVPKVRSQELISACSFLIGILLGKFLLNLIFKVQGVVVSKNRVSIGFNGLNSNLELITKYGFLIYWSMLGVIWCVLIMAQIKRNRESFALSLALLIPLLVVFLSAIHLGLYS